MNKVFGTAEDRDTVVAPTLLPRVFILFLRRKKRTLPKSSAISAIRKGITLISIFGIRKGVKKLVSVLATFTLVTGTREKAFETTKVVESTGVNKDGEESKGKDPENFAQVPCDYFCINFGKKSILALLDSGSKVNALHPTFAKELGLLIRPKDIGAQKIDGTTLDIYGMVVVVFLVKHKAN